MWFLLLLLAVASLAQPLKTTTEIDAILQVDNPVPVNTLTATLESLAPPAGLSSSSSIITPGDQTVEWGITIYYEQNLTALEETDHATALEASFAGVLGINASAVSATFTAKPSFSYDVTFTVTVLPKPANLDAIITAIDQIAPNFELLSSLSPAPQADQFNSTPGVPTPNLKETNLSWWINCSYNPELTAQQIPILEEGIRAGLVTMIVASGGIDFQASQLTISIVPGGDPNTYQIQILVDLIAAPLEPQPESPEPEPESPEPEPTDLKTRTAIRLVLADSDLWNNLNTALGLLDPPGSFANTGAPTLGNQSVTWNVTDIAYLRALTIAEVISQQNSLATTLALALGIPSSAVTVTLLEPEGGEPTYVGQFVITCLPTPPIIDTIVGLFYGHNLLIELVESLDPSPKDAQYDLFEATPDPTETNVSYVLGLNYDPAPTAQQITTLEDSIRAGIYQAIVAAAPGFQESMVSVKITTGGNLGYLIDILVATASLGPQPENPEPEPEPETEEPEPSQPPSPPPSAPTPVNVIDTLNNAEVKDNLKEFATGLVPPATLVFSQAPTQDGSSTDVNWVIEAQFDGTLSPTEKANIETALEVKVAALLDTDLSNVYIELTLTDDGTKRSLQAATYDAAVTISGATQMVASALVFLFLALFI